MAKIDIGLNFGSSNTQIYIVGRGVVLNEPSLIGLDLKKSEICAYGKRAKEMYGKTSKYIKIVQPVKNGAVADYDLALKIIQNYVKEICKNNITKPRIMCTTKSRISQVEKKALVNILKNCGARKFWNLYY